jgi:hypothetical protein
MLTKGFYYLLLIGELAILGLIIAGIYLKVKRIIGMSARRTDDQNFEHYVSESDQFARAGRDILVDGITGFPSQAGELQSGHTTWAQNS